MPPSAALTPAGASWTGSDLALVRCTVGGLNVALEAAKVQSMQNCGMQAAPTLAALLQLAEPLSASPQRLLSVAHPDGVRLIRVDEPVVLCRLPASDLRPLPPLMAAHLRFRCVRALAWLGGPPRASLLIILDLDAL